MQVCPNSAGRFPDCAGAPVHHPDTSKISVPRIVDSVCRVTNDRHVPSETRAVESNDCAATDIRAPVLMTGFSRQHPVPQILDRNGAGLPGDATRA